MRPNPSRPRGKQSAGADACIFPNFGGRFTFSQAACQDLVDGTARPMGSIKPIFPTPAGGMTLDRAPEMVDFYGPDAILLIGGDLHRPRPDIEATCRKFLHLVNTVADG